MSTRSRYYANLYKDSVALMTVSAKIMAVPGITAASAVMGSATNVENLAQAALGDFEVRPNDLIVAVSGAEEACELALQVADDLLSAKAGAADRENASSHSPITSIQMAAARDPAHNFALISVPGDYAAAEAMKALRLGMNVMVFSDNVSPTSELSLKQYARDHDLMVMGPDCGTAIVNGVPLGFANVVRRGPIGVVGASGTGTQEVTARIHQLGSGISQALGTGGHDLSQQIGGISMLHGLRALDADTNTTVIVLVSKPPAAEIATRVLTAAASCTKSVVVIFLGADPAEISRKGVYGAEYLAQAADMAVALSKGGVPNTEPITLSAEVESMLGGLARSMVPAQRYVRGIFSGGTFCFEAQLVHAAAGISAFSNTPMAGNRPLENNWKSQENTIIDMGDDEFTQGRPHPMIDPSLRNERIRDDAADPATAVVLFDVVLGYGSCANPIDDLLNVINSAKAKASEDGRTLAFVGHVCGTDLDPQGRSKVMADLKSAGVLVASSNAEAATWSSAIVAERERATS